MLTLAVVALAAQTAVDGADRYESLCASCHGSNGAGGERAPSIVERIASRTDEELSEIVRAGLPGMPAFHFEPEEFADLVRFLRALQPGSSVAPRLERVETSDGRSLEGVVLNRSPLDLQLRSGDARIHLLRRVGERYREVTSTSDWPTYHGDYRGNRFSTLSRIDTKNVRRLALKWLFALPGTARLQVTPVVVEGVMYVTGPNECYALDAGNGRRLWHYRRPRTPGLVGDASAGINRGVAVSGDRVFLVTDHAHLLALDKLTGRLLWETKMASFRENYGATSAPLAVDGLVISGTSGGDEGVRGFFAAFDEKTGVEVWRFWTVPKRGEPGSETWQGKDIDHGCASAWLTGTYDAETKTLYWPTGNPCPDFDGDERLGDNLYSDSILALDVATGRLQWHYQFTPHDVWDWDAQQPPVLVDLDWQGAAKKLLLHANRNGFFYVLDRTTGELLRATPFVKKLTWAREIGDDGRPVLHPDQEPTLEGTRVCPPIEGATNWFSTAFHPDTGLYYVQTLEKCNIFTKKPSEWRAGSSYYSGSTRTPPEDSPQKILRAIDVRTGSIAWELPQVGPADSWGGTLATAGGLVFFGEDSGSFTAVDAKRGEILWRFQTNQLWKASPMTYEFDSEQIVAVASGPNVLAFALAE
ncbi:MAG TPA: PQQ-dependent dehydrogenase, methanol/ethanol family [Vicinamibacteria bacterium]|nr:PQQ-dependent dehydrogenase, methanol/ethanol family [Vicinamibacteria bacterium]